MCVCIYLHIMLLCMSTFTSTLECNYVSMYVCNSACLDGCMYCMYVCMYVLYVLYALYVLYVLYTLHCMFRKLLLYFLYFLYFLYVLYILYVCSVCMHVHGRPWAGSSLIPCIARDVECQ